MPAIMSAHHQNRIRNLGMSAVYRIAADEGVSPSDVLDLMVAAPFTPSQPEAPSKPHAPAAQTGEGVSSSLASSPVDLSGLAAHEQGPTERPEGPQAAESPRFESVQGSREGHRPATYGELVTAGETAPPRKTKRQQVIDCHKAHPDWHSLQIAAHLELGPRRVQTIASQLGLKLPRAPGPQHPNMRDEVMAAVKANPTWSLRQIADSLNCGLGTASRWAKEARKELGLPDAEPKRAVVSKPAPQDDATDVLHRVKSAPQGRFYLIERGDPLATRRYIHQSLQPCPTGPGPLMTTDRRLAWFGTMQQFKGAMKQWPMLKDMRKEAAAK